jgi:hypothetical protein
LSSRFMGRSTYVLILAISLPFFNWVCLLSVDHMNDRLVS